MIDPMLPLSGLSPVSGKTVIAKFDGGLLSSDGGVLVLREVEQRLRVADRLAACMVDPRAPDLVTHSLADVIRFRLLMIGAGYEDGNDASSLRSDPMFKMALDLSAAAKARFEAAPKDGKVRRFKEFLDGAKSWSRVERITARVEAGADGPDTRFIVTNLKGRNPRVLYEDVYCRRGQAENHIKSWKTHLAADRTSCTKATANQLRLFLHAGAYWLMWSLRMSMPKRSMWRVAQFDTLRLRLLKLAARVVEMKTMIKIHLPTSCPAQDILRLALARIPRLVT